MDQRHPVTRARTETVFDTASTFSLYAQPSILSWQSQYTCMCGPPRDQICILVYRVMRMDAVRACVRARVWPLSPNTIFLKILAALPKQSVFYLVSSCFYNANIAAFAFSDHGGSNDKVAMTINARHTPSATQRGNTVISLSRGVQDKDKKSLLAFSPCVIWFHYLVVSIIKYFETDPGVLFSSRFIPPLTKIFPAL